MAELVYVPLAKLSESDRAEYYRRRMMLPIPAPSNYERVMHALAYIVPPADRYSVNTYRLA